MSLLLALQAAGGPVNYADSLSTGSYVLSGKTVSDSVVKADNLSTGAYTLSGKTVTDVLARNDSLSKGSYSIAGQAVTDSVVRADSLSTGTYTISGKTVSDIIARADQLSVGSYVISGKDITDAYVPSGGISYADNLSAGAYSITGYSLTDEITLGKTKDGGDDVPRKVKSEKYKPRLRKDDFGNEIQPEIEVASVKKVSTYTLQDTQLLLNRLELQAEQDDEETLLMLL